MINLDNQRTEQTAISKFKERINLTKYLIAYVDENDKTPSWDGFIAIYDSEKICNDNLTGRLPVQIKGRMVKKNLFSDKISFRMEITHLRNYLNDGGAMLFVVYLCLNENQTEYLSSIYYAELTPAKVSALISECPIVQQSVTIHLKQIPSDPNDLASVVRNCWFNCRRQASFSSAPLPSIKELDEKGLIEDIQFFVNGYGNEYREIEGFLKLDTPPYVLLKGELVPQPVKYEGEEVYKVATRTMKMNVSSAGIVYFSEYTIIMTKEKRSVQIGSSIILEFNDDCSALRLNFKASHLMRKFVSDVPFIISFIETKQFRIGDNLFDFSQSQFDTVSLDPVKLKCDYDVFSQCVTMLDKQGCPEDLDYTSLTKEDWRNLERLVQATLDGKPIYGIQNVDAPIMVINVGPLKFAEEFIPVQNSDEPGMYTIRHFQEYKDFVLRLPDTNEIIPVPACAVLKPDDYLLLSNIKYDQILSELKTFPVNSHTYGVANDIMLKMIIASDKADINLRKRLLMTALEMAEWLVTIPNDVWDKRVAILNKMQIIKRLHPLRDEDIGVLKTITELSQDRLDVLFGAYALLDRTEEALTCLKKLPESTQKEIMNYPIYYFIEGKSIQ